MFTSKSQRLIALAGAILFSFALTAFAQPASSDGLWQQVKESSLNVNAVRPVIPRAYQSVQLNKEGMLQVLAQAPMEFTNAAQASRPVITLPMPDGSFARFQIQESPISLPDPSGNVSEFKSYSGQGIDDPTATVRFDISPAGFHAQILSTGESVYIDPYSADDTINCISYYKRDLQRTGTRPECFAALSDLSRPSNAPPISEIAGGPPPPNAANGTTLRSVRTAIACTGEYTTFFRQAGDTDDQAKARALNAIKVTMNRVNGVWGRDAAVRYVLLSDTDELKIIYPNGATDPYTNNSASKLSDENQTNLDNVIGNANYDMGHVFATSPGGEGTQGICVTGDKAKGVTGTDMPVGDAFDIDFVAHEMIHQWGGNHTFNDSATGSCTAGNRNGPTAVEPGSGSTTASYAGICGNADLQANSDDYFHSVSVGEILTALATFATCPTSTATGNTPPTVTAPASFTIPQGTPFILTATASDVNGDALTYAWEEIDVGAASPPNTDDGTRPLFRPYKPVSVSSRTYPSLPYILNNANNPPATFTGTSATGSVCAPGGTCLTGEVMPVTNRTMKFRVTVRDNRAGGGGINDATTQVTVNTGSGPFLVTAPNTAITVTGGSQMTVTWNVANTTAAPVSAANVKISLSTDGGNTFPNVLAASTPNDGSEALTIPNIATTTARIKVEAVGNIFFDISDTNFTITGNGVTPGVVANVSTRLFAGKDDNALFEGFIIQGPVGSTKKLLIRGLGPFLGGFQITGFLPNPTLDIFEGSNKVAINNDWRTTQIFGLVTADQSQEIATSGFAPSNEQESTIIANLAPGNFTAVVRGFGNTDGIALVDAFDLNTASAAKVVNFATRGLVQPGNQLLTAGFIIQNGSVRAVIRAIGPSLIGPPFNITNALPDTTLQLRDQNGGLVQENDDWQTDQKAELELTGLQPTHIKEAALVRTIPPGQYSAQVRGKPEGTGVGVVEIYFIQ
ncbi:MAG: hypothetical protein QOJ45_991 [Verrucomicrobiota bacterium]|jgi:hypothetical protein